MNSEFVIEVQQNAGCFSIFNELPQYEPMSFFDKLFFFSLLSPFKASALEKLTEPSDKISGVVKNINEGWMNSVTVQLESDKRIFYMKRALSDGLNVDSMRSKLSGKQVTILFRKNENRDLSQPVPLTQIIFEKEIIFCEI